MSKSSLYFAVRASDGTLLTSVPMCARWHDSRGAWVDDETGRTIEFVGLVCGTEVIYSSTSPDDVEQWLTQS